ncbi:tRNA preQ1(34) S-adenosylmethionine ribosyltransferase-isomerase QueA [Orrella sp. 11846]|uniref:tRNA preQ1(34) S-adenosylmethionine ribosyltransferase-isomerase QueA n=1 Tax=Orrella sp. 11846 TaxID=3409913 RepID=UPI003B5CBAC0
MTPNIFGTLTLDDFDYELPQRLIAQFPASERTASRLLHMDAQGQLIDRQFPDLLQLLQPGDLLVFNNTQVIKARLYGHKASGGRVEALVERLLDTHTVLAHMRASKAPKPDTSVTFSQDSDTYQAQVTARQDDLFVLRFEDPVLEVLQAIGHVPLPPYITKEDDEVDATRYQTVYARHPGAVAAPTAGLHFDEHFFIQLEAMGVKTAYVTLHVGAGTFAPVRDNDLAKHKMHHEHYTLDQACIDAIRETRARGGRVIAVGTTSVRALESNAAQFGSNLQAAQDDTQLFITPGFQWQVVDAMVTNFHLPRSTLLMLVAAFCGLENMKQAYLHAVAQGYRFFSYGDAMFLEARITT